MICVLTYCGVLGLSISATKIYLSLEYERCPLTRSIELSTDSVIPPAVLWVLSAVLTHFASQHSKHSSLFRISHVFRQPYLHCEEI